PAGARQSARIGSKQYITENETGTLLSDARLAEDLEKFAERYESYSPRKAVMRAGIDWFGSTKVLNDVLRQSSERWTVDLAPHHWRPNPTYVNNEDALRLRDEAAAFPEKYGFPVGGMGLAAPPAVKSDD